MGGVLWGSRGGLGVLSARRLHVGCGVERAEGATGGRHAAGGEKIRLVEHKHVCHLYLIRQQFPHKLLLVTPPLARLQPAHESIRIQNGDDGVEAHPQRHGGGRGKDLHHTTRHGNARALDHHRIQGVPAPEGCGVAAVATLKRSCTMTRGGWLNPAQRDLTLASSATAGTFWRQVGREERGGQGKMPEPTGPQGFRALG